MLLLLLYRYYISGLCVIVAAVDRASHLDRASNFREPHKLICAIFAKHSRLNLGAFRSQLEPRQRRQVSTSLPLVRALPLPFRLDHLGSILCSGNKLNFFAHHQCCLPLANDRFAVSIVILIIRVRVRVRIQSGKFRFSTRDSRIHHVSFARLRIVF